METGGADPIVHESDNQDLDLQQSDADPQHRWKN
jgi:hypothetical protein